MLIPSINRDSVQNIVIPNLLRGNFPKIFEREQITVNGIPAGETSFCFDILSGNKNYILKVKTFSTLEPTDRQLQIKENRIRTIYNLIDQITSDRLLLPKLYKNKEGTVTGKIAVEGDELPDYLKNRMFFLMEKLPVNDRGEMPSPALLGKTLGIFHNTIQEDTKETDLTSLKKIDVFKLMCSRLSVIRKLQSSEFFLDTYGSEKLEKLRNTINILYINLPDVNYMKDYVLHGDVSGGNLLLLKDGRASIIDFDEMCIGSRVRDVAVLVRTISLGFKTSGNWNFQPDTFNEFMDSYNAHKRSSLSEFSASVIPLFATADYVTKMLPVVERLVDKQKDSDSRGVYSITKILENINHLLDLNLTPYAQLHSKKTVSVLTSPAGHTH